MASHRKPLNIVAPICDYCRNPAALLKDSSSLYHGKDYGPVWCCSDCDAWVGVHKNSPSFMPLGRLANAELRKAKHAVHVAFDPLWERKMVRDGCSKKEARGAAYEWLAEQMGLPVEKTHIGMFDVEQCMRALVVIGRVGKKDA